MVTLKLALPLMLPVWLAASGSGIPDLDVKSTCQARGTGASAATEGCMRDELGARDELAKTWSRAPADVRGNCAEEVRIGGSASYVELLTCVEMHEWSRQTPGSAAPAEGAQQSGPAARRAPSGGAR